MELKADFFADWVAILKDILSNQWGYNLSAVPDEDIPIVYFDIFRRRAEQKPRQLMIADTFVCPPALNEGWLQLKTKISAGEDLTANLSKLINKPTNKDAMLNDWGVHHFHLGTELEGKFIERTGPLLYALLMDDCFYAIGIFDHGGWVNQDVVEIMHRNWPSILERYKVLGVHSDDLSFKPTEDDRFVMRKKQVNSFTTVSDGTTYMPIGSGSSGAGYSLDASFKRNAQFRLLNKIQKHFADNLEDFRAEFERHGYTNEPEIKATLHIEGEQYSVFFPEYGILCPITL